MGFPSTILIAASIALAALVEEPPAESGSAVQPEDDPAAEQTRALFDEAATLYETSQYNGAVEIYTQAYQRSVSIEDEDLRGQVQAAILFNLASAHFKAYALDENAEHLRQTVDLLDKYLAQTADLADQRDAEKLLEQARAELARVDAEQRANAEAEPAPPAPPSATEGEGGRGLQIGGYALLGLGVAAGGVAISGAVLAPQARADYIAGPTRDERNQAEDAGRLANNLLVAGSVSAGVLVGVGIALAVVGRKRSRMSPTAWATPTSFGLSVGGSF